MPTTGTTASPIPLPRVPLTDEAVLKPKVPMLEPRRILIISSQTGGGHRSAARALEASLTALGGPMPLKVTIAHRFLEDSSTLSRCLAWIYNHLLRHHQESMHHYFRWIESVKLHQQPVVIRASWQHCKRLLERFRPSAVVSVHPMTQYIFAKMLKALGWADKVPLITVVTDPGSDVWQGWACPDVHQYFVPSKDSKDYLMRLGVPPEKIIVSGMPVHPRFLPVCADADKHQLQANLGLQPGLFTVFLNAGWAGGGNIPGLLDALLDDANRSKFTTPFQVVFVAGRNKKLYAETRRKVSAASFPVTVLSYIQNMEQWMQASDVIVTKLGGLTTFEALSCQVPILADCITRPMPQEAETVNMIARTDTGLLIYSEAHFLETVQILMESPALLGHLKAQAVKLSAAGAADRIARQIVYGDYGGFEPQDSESLALCERVFGLLPDDLPATDCDDLSSSLLPAKSV
jgi:UDP-N-acetylglucosamine:LPS N-acetylglucosamine transferase